MTTAKIYLVHTGNQDVLRETLLALPGVEAFVVDGTWDEVHQTCHVRVRGDAGFFLFAMPHQGYGEVLSEVPGE